MENITLKSIISEVGLIITPNDEKCNLIITNIRKKVKKYVEDNKLQSLVIGISGGLDSSVVAALCQEKYIGVPLIGLSIPMSSSNEHKEQAQWIGNKYCSNFEEFIDFDEKLPKENNLYGSVYQPFYDILFGRLEKTDRIANKAGFKTETFPKSILQGNMKARLRMITLYDLARKTNGLVLSTDNLSEFNMGFWTICGDVGDYGPIQNLGKGFELPAIAKALGIREDIITQPPSDGLMVTEDNTDEAQLGANYKEVDTIMAIVSFSLEIGEKEKQELKSKLFSIDIDGAKIGKVLLRYENMHYKRNGTLNLTRKDIGI